LDATPRRSAGHKQAAPVSAQPANQTGPAGRRKGAGVGRTITGATSSIVRLLGGPICRRLLPPSELRRASAGALQATRALFVLAPGQLVRQTREAADVALAAPPDAPAALWRAERERDSRPDAGPQVECSRGSHARAKIINNFPSLSRISPSGSRRPPIAQRSISVPLSLRQDTFILCSAFSLPGESCQAREAAEGKAPQSSSGRPRRKEEAACNWAREAHTWKAERGKSRAERVFQTVTGCEQLS